MDIPVVTALVYCNCHFNCHIAEPVRCLPGTFQNMTGTDYCMDCPAGFYCTDGEIPLSCPRGRYCPGNTTADQPMCPRGSYNPQLGNAFVLIMIFDEI